MALLLDNETSDRWHAMIADLPIGSLWTHYNGTFYRVTDFSNVVHGMFRAEHPPRVHYVNARTFNLHDRAIDDWHRSMSRVTDPAIINAYTNPIMFLFLFGPQLGMVDQNEEAVQREIDGGAIIKYKDMFTLNHQNRSFNDSFWQKRLDLLTDRFRRPI